jgi:hypothetical protein
VTNKHMERCSTSLNVRRMKKETIMRRYLTLSPWQSFKSSMPCANYTIKCSFCPSRSTVYPSPSRQWRLGGPEFRIHFYGSLPALLEAEDGCDALLGAKLLGILLSHRSGSLWAQQPFHVTLLWLIPISTQFTIL